ncbi:uncharacterized [Tachysurus ichikawai]
MKVIPIQGYSQLGVTDIRQSIEPYSLSEADRILAISDRGVKWHLSSLHRLTMFQLDSDAKVLPCAQGLSFSLPSSSATSALLLLQTPTPTLPPRRNTG